jgi:pimeloyl-ACP methyl ester carboxylesterase
MIAPDPAFRRYDLALPGRGSGCMSVTDFGPPSRDVDCVFLHANGFNAFTYRRLLAPLADDWRILALDQRGHGATTLQADPAGRTDWLDLRDDLLAALQSLDLAGVVLSGHSMGGTVSLLAAAEEPGRARALVLLDPVMIEATARTSSGESPMVTGARRRRATFPDRDAALAAYRGRGAFATWPEPVLLDYLAAGLKDQADGTVSLACSPQWEASNYAAQGHDSWRALATFGGPVRVLAAETGSTFHLSEARVAGGLPTGVTVERLRGSTHFIPMEQPGRVREALVEAFRTPA